MNSFTPNGLIVAHHGISVEVLFDNSQRRMVRVKRNSGHVVGDNVQQEAHILGFQGFSQGSQGDP